MIKKGSVNFPNLVIIIAQLLPLLQLLIPFLLQCILVCEMRVYICPTPSVLEEAQYHAFGFLSGRVRLRLLPSAASSGRG